MSLLLDALKRAEQEKRARQGERQPGPEENSTPVEPSRTPPAPKALELESVAPAPESVLATARTTRDREAAQAVFTAKKPAGTRSRNVVIAAGVLALLALAGGGAWVWYQINGLPPIASRSPIAAPRPVTPAPAAEALKPESVAPVASAGPATPANAVAPRARVPKAEAEQMVMSLLKDSASSPLPAPLKLSRSLDAPRVPAEIAQGYEALRRGELVIAKSRYEAALALDPFNVDASLGLATIAASSGDRLAAAAHYRRALELDSKNAPALAGLASLADYSRPDSLEAQMRADLTRYPQSAALHFALGNLYAAQSRWTDAQAAFFEAHRLSPDDADIAYNLAVSLDHLGQSRVAADYYQRALAAGRVQAAQFDRSLVQRRLAELKP